MVLSRSDQSWCFIASLRIAARIWAVPAQAASSAREGQRPRLQALRKVRKEGGPKDQKRNDAMAGAIASFQILDPGSDRDGPGCELGISVAASTSETEATEGQQSTGSRHGVHCELDGVQAAVCGVAAEEEAPFRDFKADTDVPAVGHGHVRTTKAASLTVALFTGGEDRFAVVSTIADEEAHVVVVELGAPSGDVSAPAPSVTSADPNQVKPMKDVAVPPAPSASPWLV